jgi:hypothetical protein
LLIKYYLGLDASNLEEEEYEQLLAQAEWIEERQISVMAAAIAKAFGSK